MKRLFLSATFIASLVPVVAFAQDQFDTYAPPAYQQPTLGQAAAVFSYSGAHPNHPSFGGGFCYAQGMHTHPYSVDPNIAYLYRNYAGSNVFVGNVYEFGYARQAFPYYNHHPLAPEQGGTYCYIDGAHYHSFVPSLLYAANHITYNGYYYYNGAYLPSYYSWRNNYYRSYHTYRYLPGYSRYYTNYRTYATTYGRPASVAYMRNRVGYTGRPGAYGATNARSYNRSNPAYRYNSARPTTYSTGYRPAATSYRPTTSSYRPATGGYRPATGGYRPATGGSAYSRPTSFTSPSSSYRPSTSTSSARPAARVWRR